MSQRNNCLILCNINIHWTKYFRFFAVWLHIKRLISEWSKCSNVWDSCSILWHFILPLSFPVITVGDCIVCYMDIPVLFMSVYLSKCSKRFSMLGCFFKTVLQGYKNKKIISSNWFFTSPLESYYGVLFITFHFSWIVAGFSASVQDMIPFGIHKQ